MANFSEAKRGILRLAILGCRSCFSFIQAAEDRVPGREDSNQTVAIKGAIHPKAQPENDVGPVDALLPIANITLTLKPSPSQQLALDQLLEEQRDPASPDYQRWLTPEEFGARFGISANDLTKVTSWLQLNGFVIDEVARGLNWISFSGIAQQVEKAFHTGIHRFIADGETHFANATEPSIPAAFAPIIGEIRGLNDFRLKPGRSRTSA